MKNGDPVPGAGAEGMNVKYIADVYTDMPGKFGIPRQSGMVPGLAGRVVFRPEFRDPSALRRIDGFSHLWILFDFSLAHRDGWSPTVRPPRLGGNTRVGVFASRSPFRPNPIGLSCVRLERVEHDPVCGDVLIVSGVDMVSGTPVIDIKPYLPFADARPDAVSGYSPGDSVRLDVTVPDGLLKLIPEDRRDALVSCLALDPRPSYQDDPDRIYSFGFAGYTVRFVTDGIRLTVTGIEPEIQPRAT